MHHGPMIHGKMNGDGAARKLSKKMADIFLGQLTRLAVIVIGIAKTVNTMTGYMRQKIAGEARKKGTYTQNKDKRQMHL